jgi:hypothetical protein
MKLREIIIVEDGEASVATVSSDIATVAYPLFVRGKSKKEKRKNARAAVGQKYVPGPDGIGQGVFENQSKVGKAALDYKRSNRYPDGESIPNSLPPRYQPANFPGVPAKQNCANCGYYDKASKKCDKFSSEPVVRPSYWCLKWEPMEKSVEEAHVLNHDNVIYRLDRDNPMSDTEVAVLGGAGRYSLQALRDKARREAAALAQDLSIEHGGAFRRSAENIKQLTNTINTIVAAYNELARLRRRGGRGSRGITDEDAGFIRECIRVVEQAAQNYRLLENVAIEPDAAGYEPTKLTSPKYAVVVDTPSDYDWYKIGNHWHDRIIDPHEFGQEDSDTVMVAAGDADFKDMLAKLDHMGFTYKKIGGTHSQPEIHKGRKE